MGSGYGLSSNFCWHWVSDCMSAQGPPCIQMLQGKHLCSLFLFPSQRSFTRPESSNAGVLSWVMYGTYFCHRTAAIPSLPALPAISAGDSCSYQPQLLKGGFVTERGAAFPQATEIIKHLFHCKKGASICQIKQLWLSWWVKVTAGMLFAAQVLLVRQPLCANSSLTRR